MQLCVRSQQMLSDHDIGSGGQCAPGKAIAARRYCAGQLPDPAAGARSRARHHQQRGRLGQGFADLGGQIWPCGEFGTVEKNWGQAGLVRQAGAFQTAVQLAGKAPIGVAVAYKCPVIRRGNPCRTSRIAVPTCLRGRLSQSACNGNRRWLGAAAAKCGRWVTLWPTFNQSIKSGCQAGQTVFYSYAQPLGQGLGKQGEWANEG